MAEKRMYTVNPMPGYMGAQGYRGNNAFRSLYGAELSKAIRQALKEDGIKGVSVRVQTYTGGQSITLTIKAKPTDYVPMLEYVENAEWRDIAPFDQVEDPLHPGHTFYWYDVDPDEQESLRYRVAEKHMRDFATGNRQINHYCLERYTEFKPEFLKKLQRINQIVTSFNYDESNSQVDYFDCGFYPHWYIKNEGV